MFFQGFCCSFGVPPPPARHPKMFALPALESFGCSWRWFLACWRLKKILKTFRGQTVDSNWQTSSGSGCQHEWSGCQDEWSGWTKSSYRSATCKSPAKEKFSGHVQRIKNNAAGFVYAPTPPPPPPTIVSFEHLWICIFVSNKQLVFVIFKDLKEDV